MHPARAAADRASNRRLTSLESSGRPGCSRCRARRDNAEALTRVSPIPRGERVIQSSVGDSVLGLRNMRNLAVHAPTDRLTPKHARESSPGKLWILALCFGAERSNARLCMID